MKPYWQNKQVTIWQGDCLAVMRTLPDASIDTVLTDPPYCLEFMGKSWDKVLPGVEYWTEALRVAKPGTILMAFGGTRTYHRLTCAIEDAGWQIRDCIMWLYGSGFPKSLDISKAIDKQHGAKRPTIRKAYSWNRPENSTPTRLNTSPREYYLTAPATDAAKQWHGYGTALKPAFEPIIVAMKPLDGTFANNAVKHGVAGLWIDGGRIATGEDTTTRHNSSSSYMTRAIGELQPKQDDYFTGSTQGRWPANIIHDGSADVQAGFPQQQSDNRAAGVRKGLGYHGGNGDGGPAIVGRSGSASRFFYTAKATRRERERIEGMPTGTRNKHPTVKPLSLMTYLAKLTRTPAGGVIFDPFMGSGTTGMAALKTNRKFIGIDQDPQSCRIAKLRILRGRLAGDPVTADTIAETNGKGIFQAEFDFEK